MVPTVAAVVEVVAEVVQVVHDQAAEGMDLVADPPVVLLAYTVVAAFVDMRHLADCIRCLDFRN